MREKPPKNFGFVLKHHVAMANEFAEGVAKYLQKNKCKIIISDDAKQFSAKFPNLEIASKSKLLEKCDAILVFGGDGTFLSLARHILKRSIPILGINLGHLGFLTETSVDQAYKNLALILEGKFVVQEREMLSVSIKTKKNEKFVSPVLNDAVITNADIARIIDLELSIDGVNVAVIKADGLIISTPTGSTAYSLAAGGPIIHPSVSAITVAAICPHSLTIRPIVVPNTSTIDVKILKKDGPTLLTLDGQSGYDLKPGDIVRIKKYRHSLKMISCPGQDYFKLLRNKLKLGARGEENQQC